MNKLIRIAGFAGWVALFSASANAQNAVSHGLPASQDSTSVSPWLHFENYNGLYMGPGGGWVSGSSSEASVRLGAGVSIGIVSSLSNAASGAASMNYGNGLASGPMNGWSASHLASYIGPGQGLNLVPGNSLISSTGGKISMDLGRGVSVNFVGGVSQSSGAGFYAGPGNPLGLSSGGTLSTGIGAGLSMDLGDGSSLSIGGGVSRTSGSGLLGDPCGNLSPGRCR